MHSRLSSFSSAMLARCCGYTVEENQGTGLAGKKVAWISDFFFLFFQPDRCPELPCRVASPLCRETVRKAEQAASLETQGCLRYRRCWTLGLALTFLCFYTGTESGTSLCRGLIPTCVCCVPVVKHLGDAGFEVWLQEKGILPFWMGNVVLEHVHASRLQDLNMWVKLVV